ncbi:hypothetical protein, partial [Pseudogulbenkiania ferrooxidans]|uniref:hypothetical protein n=1 Tax=Pseudogulbenkiania ferrooxidans TaxID=549169 RepID=UPI0004CF0467
RLAPADADALRQAGSELGVSLRLRALADGQARSLSLNGRRVAEAEVRWRAEYDRAALLASADRLQSSALDGARRQGPEVGAAMAGFLAALDAPVSEGRQ